MKKSEFELRTNTKLTYDSFYAVKEIFACCGLTSTEFYHLIRVFLRGNLSGKLIRMRIRTRYGAIQFDDGSYPVQFVFLHSVSCCNCIVIKIPDEFLKKNKLKNSVFKSAEYDVDYTDCCGVIEEKVMVEPEGEYMVWK